MALSQDKREKKEEVFWSERSESEKPQREATLRMEKVITNFSRPQGYVAYSTKEPKGLSKETVKEKIAARQAELADERLVAEAKNCELE